MFCYFNMNSDNEVLEIRVSGCDTAGTSIFPSNGPVSGYNWSLECAMFLIKEK